MSYARGGWGSGGLALLFGIMAILVAFLQPGSGSSVGYFASTICPTAVAAGVHALHMNRYGPRRILAFARIAIVFGIVSSIAMLYSIIVAGLATLGVALPPDPFTLDRMFPNSAIAGSSAGLPVGAAAPGTAPTAPVAVPISPAALPTTPTEAPSATITAPAPTAAAPSSTQLFTTPTSRADEAQDLFYMVAGLRTTLIYSHPAGSPWPATLATSQESAWQRVTLPTGRTLVSLPPDARLIYTVSSDRTEYSIDIIGGTYGADAHYDSISNAITTR